MLDARGAISVSERTAYIGRIRKIARRVAEAHVRFREEMGFPLCDKDIPASSTRSNNEKG